MSENKKRLGSRNPLQLFNKSQQAVETELEPVQSLIQNQESGIQNQESGIQNQESGIQNQESKIGNSEPKIQDQELPTISKPQVKDPESRIRNHESGIMNQELTINPESLKLYSLSVRIPELLNDHLDEALKKTRRSMGRKIRKEVLVAIAIEAMFEQVEIAGGWSAIVSEEELRHLLGLKT
jgi:hypothetical protein